MENGNLTSHTKLPDIISNSILLFVWSRFATKKDRTCAFR